jgi:hypothetical protein
LSARSGEGIDAWLDEVLSGRTPAGLRVLEGLDYGRYARAEALLAWLNATVSLHAKTPLSPAQVIGPLVEFIDAKLTGNGVRIAHLKAWIESPRSWLRVSMTANGQEPVVEGDRLAPPDRSYSVVINLRAQGEPATLKGVVEAALSTIPGKCTVDRIDCFRPLPPKPERRYANAGTKNRKAP